MGYFCNPNFCLVYGPKPEKLKKKFFSAKPALKKIKIPQIPKPPQLRRFRKNNKKFKRKNKNFKSTFKHKHGNSKKYQHKKKRKVPTPKKQISVSIKNKIVPISSGTKIYLRKVTRKYPKLFASSFLKKDQILSSVKSKSKKVASSRHKFVTSLVSINKHILTQQAYKWRLYNQHHIAKKLTLQRRRRRIYRDPADFLDSSKLPPRHYKEKVLRGLYYRLPNARWLVANRILKKDYKLRFMKLGKFTFNQTNIEFLKRSKVSRLSEIRTNDFTSLQFVLYFLRKRIAEQARIRAIALAKTKTIFKQQNSKRGLAHYFLALKVFRKRKILKFLKYRNVIVPFLKKRYNIFFKTKHKIYKRYARMRALKTLMLAFLHKEQLFTQRAAYRRFLIMQKGLRFMYANLKNSVLRKIGIGVRKKKINQLFFFFEQLITLLPAFLVYNYFMPRVLFAKQFIRFGFIAVNGELCQNTNYLVKVKDIVEVDKLYFIKLFIQDDLHDTYRKFLAKKMLLVPGFLYNYRLLILLYAEPLRKTARFHRINRFEFRNFKFRFYRVLFNNLLHYV